MYIGLIGNYEQTPAKVFNLDTKHITIYISLGLTIIASVVLTTFCIFQISHSVIRPLRQLNSKMRESIESKSQRDISADQKSDQCAEINELYDVFRDLIRNKKCMDNEFLEMEDSLAIMELAGMCTMFEGQNYKYAGICYSNIANLQFKN